MDFQKDRQRKKSKTDRGVIYGILLMITILSLGSSIFLLYFYQQEKEKAITAMQEMEIINQEIEAKEQEIVLKDQEIEENEQEKENLEQSYEGSMTVAEAEELAEERAASRVQEMLDKMQEMMENGDGPLSLLQHFYPNHVVVSGDGRYFFFPILEHLEKNNFNLDNFSYPMENEDTGRYEGVAAYRNEDGSYARKGVDVSTFQGEIDWEKVRDDGIEYAIIRLGFRGYESGKIVLDARYEQNIEGALAAGLDTGVYFFTEALTEKEAIEEADFVIENLEGYEINMPVVIDVEESADPQATRTKNLTPEQRTKNVIAFCNRVKDAGYDVMIYGNLNSFMRMMDIEQLEGYDKWFAYYRYPFHFPYKVKMWQYASWEKVDGISGGADVNLMFY